MYSDRQRSSARSQAQVRTWFAIFLLCLLLSAAVFSFVYGSGKGSDGPKTKSLNQTTSGRSDQISINRATVAELKTLPGIGEATAQRIVDYRSKNPPFRRIEELLIIRGISRNRLEQLRNRIRLD